MKISDLRQHFESYCKVRNDDEKQKEEFEQFVKRISYVSGGYDSDVGFDHLKNALDHIEVLYKSKFQSFNN